MMAEKINTLWGIKIWGDDGIYYYTEVDISQSLTHYVPTEVKDPYNSQYPWVIHNGIASYYKGSVSGNFSDNQNTDCYSDYNLDYVEKDGIIYYNTKYQNAFVKWLHNKKTKYLQLSEHLVIPVKIGDSIQWSTDKSIDDGYTCKISLDWYQVADEFSLDQNNYNSYCNQCGQIIAPAALFCQHCGTEVKKNE